MMKCKQCGKSGFREFWQVARHARKEHPKTEVMPTTERETEEEHVCYRCDDHPKFKTSRTLKQHMRNEHGIKGSRNVRADAPHEPRIHVHTCPECGTQFAVIGRPSDTSMVGDAIRVAMQVGAHTNGEPR